MFASRLNKIITKWKGHEYVIDEDIPAPYLMALVWSRLMMLVWGKLRFVKNGGLFFLSFRAKIKCGSRLRVGRSVTISSGCYIDALSSEGIRFGNNVSVGMNTKIEGTGNLQFLGKGLLVGNNVGLGSDNFFGCAGGIIIGDDTIIGNYVSFHSENHVYDDLSTPIRLQGVKHDGIKLGKNCWIGAKSTILDGAVIGNGCIIAAGAVVKKGKYEDNGIYGGVPARLLMKREELFDYA